MISSDRPRPAGANHLGTIPPCNCNNDHPHPPIRPPDTQPPRTGPSAAGRQPPVHSIAGSKRPRTGRAHACTPHMPRTGPAARAGPSVQCRRARGVHDGRQRRVTRISLRILSRRAARARAARTAIGCLELIELCVYRPVGVRCVHCIRS